VPLRVALISASSYGGTRTSPGALSVNSSLVPGSVGTARRYSGRYLRYWKNDGGLLDAVQQFGPASVKSAVLLWKTERTCVDLVPDFFGFQIPDEFVVGYGLDYNDEFRHLPFVGIPDADDLHMANGGSTWAMPHEAPRCPVRTNGHLVRSAILRICHRGKIDQ
jgi:hypoxanthine phosphoribosyltransferase